MTPSIVSWSVGKSKRGKKRVKEADSHRENIKQNSTFKCLKDSFFLEKLIFFNQFLDWQCPFTISGTLSSFKIEI